MSALLQQHHVLYSPSLTLDQSCQHRLTALTKLRELRLYDNKLTTLQGLEGCSALHTLDVSTNKLSSLQVGLLHPCMEAMCASAGFGAGARPQGPAWSSASGK